jgi:hypothetical protein
MSQMETHEDWPVGSEVRVKKDAANIRLRAGYLGTVAGNKYGVDVKFRTPDGRTFNYRFNYPQADDLLELVS